MRTYLRDAQMSFAAVGASSAAEGFFSVGELALRYHVSPSTVRRWLRQKRLVAVRLPGGTYRIPLAAVAELEGMWIATERASDVTR